MKRALDESLRYDYGPGQTVDYYEECCFRLEQIGADLKLLKAGKASTSAIVAQLWDLASRLTLIERSHLGEFSWPFADAIRRIAAKLLSEDEDLKGPLDPIIHMIAEGTSYQILSENILNPSKRRRMFTVAFPRQLKHHVLMHALFGHELGHATFYSTRNSDDAQGDGQSASHGIVDALRREGPLRDGASAMEWLKAPDAPDPVRQRALRAKVPLTEENLEHWHVELLCDLFGLVIFGPAFSAAHRAYLEPSRKSPFDINIEKTSHPAYALRRSLPAQALRLLGWDGPVIAGGPRPLQRAEEEFLRYISDDHGPWSRVFTDVQVEAALAQINARFAATGADRARRPEPATLEVLLRRIERHLPPVGEEIDRAGATRSFEVRPEEQLYAGWTYWLGKEHLADREPLDFFQLNQLCDLALLQQQAIELIAGRRTL